ncbi:MAG: TRAP-type uncharacterized transport system, fused permease component [Firmicutes bacterium]|nr:TRAP-type uncharacterized transport system, fused permease component [Bacillota bacterium]
MKRELQGNWKKVFYWISVAMGAFYFYTAGFGLVSTESHRGMYLMFNSVLCLILYGGSKRSKKVGLIDIALILMSIVTFGYWIKQYPSYAIYRFASPNIYDTVFGVVAIIVLLESVRRVMGWVLVIITTVFLGQLYYGPYLPGILSHRGFSLVRIIEFSYSTMEGMFGVVTDTFATYVIPFIIFGSILEVSGAGEFFIQLAKSATKNWVGGPAKMSVLASGLIGSITGSSAANVVTTGVFTIPMMKRVGFKGEEAGGIEAAASTGGQYLPPVMGAGAFLLAVFSETSYLKVAAMNVVPALLYFYWVGWSIHHRALKMNIQVNRDEEIPPAKETLKKGWYYFLPMITIVVLLLMHYSPPFCAFYSILLTIALSWINPKNRITPKRFADALASAAKNNLSVGATIGVLGLVLSAIVLAGLGAKFGALVVALSHGNLFIAIILISVVSTLVGMGATQTGTYIVVSLVAVPALTSMGVSHLVAHVISFWTAGLSNVTPPVCVSAYAAASIADADPMKTGVCGLKYSTMLYVAPFVFAYFPQMLLQGTPFQIIYIFALYLLATPIATAALQGYWFKRLSLPQRLFVGAIGFFVLIPNMLYNALAFGALGLFHYYAVNRPKNTLTHA